MEPITVYVRLGENGDKSARTLTFPTPEGINQGEALKTGLAIDGNEFVGAVYKGEKGRYHHTGVCPKPHTSLPSALRCIQLRLLRWLEGHGYAADFQ